MRSAVGRAVRQVLLAIVLAACACAPRACDQGDEETARDVELMVHYEGQRARAAQARLIARGADAVPIIEAGRYQADAAGRRRIVAALARIGDPVVRPILEHMAERDSDETVRNAARSAVADLP